MKNSMITAITAAALCVPAFAFACDHDNKQAAAPGKASVKVVSVSEVARFRKASQVVVLDANSSDFRAQNGVIPGALLLTNYRTYEPVKELPAAKNQKLVFYCAATQCKASHAAAEKALEAGYEDVSVMPDGLMGWKNAGQPTASPQS